MARLYSAERNSTAAEKSGTRRSEAEAARARRGEGWLSDGAAVAGAAGGGSPAVGCARPRDARREGGGEATRRAARVGRGAARGEEREPAARETPARGAAAVDGWGARTDSMASR